MKIWKRPFLWSGFLFLFSIIFLIVGVIVPAGGVNTSFGTTYIYLTEKIPFLVHIIGLSWLMGILSSVCGVAISFYRRERIFILASASLLALGLGGIYLESNYVELVVNHTITVE